MDKTKTLILTAILVVAASAGRHFYAEEAKKDSPQPAAAQTAKYPYDLGNATVDVSAYPPEIQKNYKTFLAVCSSCHTAARPLNAPLINADDWHRYVRRMHNRMDSRGVNLEAKTAKQVVDFLVYDSKIRKIDGKAAFEAEQKRLQELFEEVTREREKMIAEETLKLPKKELPYMGVK